MPDPRKERADFDSRRRERIDWASAHAFYLSLGSRRTFGKVAVKFGVSDTAVRKHAKREGWRQDAKRFDAETARRAEAAMVRTRVERIAEQIAVTDATRIAYTEALQRGEVRLTGRDVAALARVEALLEGEATERVERTELDSELRRWINTAREFVPEERWDEFLTQLEAGTD